MPGITIKNNEIIKRFHDCHGDKYDYSKMIYTRSDKKIIVTCPEHGDFNILPNHHWRGVGCKKCSINSKIQKTTKSTETYISEAKNIWGDIYDYSETVYTHSNKPLTIICKIHGKFEQIPNNHLLGWGCPQCLKESKSNKFGNDFFTNAKILHQNKYSYEKSIYIDSYTKLIITCPEHGDFEQTPNNHLAGKGCPQCSNNGKPSKYELELHDFVNSIFNDVIFNSRNILNGQELDIFIPSLKLGIEFNGLYWHSELKKTKKYHLDKTLDCLNRKIKLIHIFEDEWVHKKDIVKSRLLNIFGKTENKIYARKCSIQEINKDVAKAFLNINHIQGFVSSQYYYGLFYQEQLVSLMSFGELRKNLGQKQSEEDSFELLRFCNKLNTSVIGGASKLFKHFITNIKPKRIISYADRRWSTGTLYENLGFTFSHDSDVNYFYVIGQNRKNRYNFRKDILIKEYGCSVEDTEHNFCFNQGWYRIYDCGNKVYEYIIK
ncbi:hypothetical protein M0Q97_02285 [Candidatus Dojkabacteria bacterium]|jgi:hypothetical protein|nr:hypothetical protein [Candidatus Dojkabacteria bacterium]